MAAKPHDPDSAPSVNLLVDKQDKILIQKMCWAVEGVIRFNREDKRVLIYVKENTTARTLNEIILAAGYDSCEISNISSASERAYAINRFNDANQETDALITTFALGSAGLNFHGACHRGLILEYPTNLDDMVDATSCLQNGSQTEPVQWCNSYIHGTLDMLHDLVLARKAAAKLAADGKRYPGITGELRMICAFHTVAVIVGQSSSRYPRVRVHWTNMETDEIKREGLFYSAVAKFLEENPGSASKFNSNTMATIAKSWKPEKGLTMDHVDGKLPEIDDSVVLYNYVVGGYKEGML
ncbi:hypothetical protein FSARC_11343 [Fusarium sarcochroum]|uniref:Helicase C-terminal domain-containing protein n=1 Tax=Fusarium sarcochroum TaxID=1208366 RepID=A0A8H4TGH3_9HYPO|nr:hypothetical protein FSARC_11343 [Fusarium sarcochroum]